MADDADLDFLLMAEELMIVHFARNESISTSRDGSIQQERARTTTERHLSDRPAQQLVALHAFRLETLSEHQHQVVGSYSVCMQRISLVSYLANHSFSAFHTVNLFLASEETKVAESEFLSYFEVDTTLCRIHIRMHGNDGNIVLDSLSHGALHIVFV